MRRRWSSTDQVDQLDSIHHVAPASRNGCTSALAAAGSSPGVTARRRRLVVDEVQPVGGVPAMFTIQSVPNRSLTIPNWSPHGAFSSGIVTVPPSTRRSQ